MEKKITKKDCINMLLEMGQVQENIDCVNYLRHELELLDNRKKGGNGPTAKAKAATTEYQKRQILEFLATKAEPVTASEITNNAGAVDLDDNPLSIQKIVSLLKKLIEEGKVSKKVEKRKTTFVIVKNDKEEPAEELEESTEAEIEESAE